MLAKTGRRELSVTGYPRATSEIKEKFHEPTQHLSIRRHSRGLGLASTAMLGMLSGPAHAQTAKDLVGTYQLVSAVSTAADGTKTNAYGPNPVGIAIFDSMAASRFPS